MWYYRHMAHLLTKEELDLNLVEMDTKKFKDDYNRSIPDSFPRVTVGILNIFQETYPSLFKRNKLWTIDKHRKKVMDWHASYNRRMLV